MGNLEDKAIVDVIRIRRITGYLVGSLNRWNDAKLTELKERTKHAGGNIKGVYYNDAVGVY